MKRKIGKLILQRDGSYKDQYGNIVIINKKNNIGYIVDKEMMKAYRFYSERYMIPVVVLIFVGYFFESLLLGLFCGLLSFILIFVAYKVYFLPKLEKVDNLEIEGQTKIIEKLKKSGLSMNVFRLILFFVIVIGVGYVLIKTENWSSNYLIKNYNEGIQILLFIIIEIWAMVMIYIETRIIVELKSEKNKKEDL